MMKKTILFCLLAMLVCVTKTSAKSGIIPTYRSFVLWIEGNDSVYSENRTMLLTSLSPDSSVTITIRHQDWNNMVNNISEDLMQPWLSIISTHRGILADIDINRPNVGALNLLRAHQSDMPMAMDVMAMGDETDRLTMDLNTQYMISNNSNEELIINDMNRGTTWYLPVGMYLIMDMGKLPQASLLRISSSANTTKAVKYAFVGSSSFTMKYTIAYECSDYWVFNLNEEITVNGSINDFTGILGLKDRALQTHYIRCDKKTFEQKEMSESEVYKLNHQK